MNEEVEISNQQKSVKNIGLWNNEVWAKRDFMHFKLEVKGGLISEDISNLVHLQKNLVKIFPSLSFELDHKWNFITQNSAL